MKRRRIAWLFVALGLPVAAASWALGTHAGAKTLARTIEWGLARSGVGSIDLKLTQPLISGIHAGPGHWLDASGHTLASWHRIELSRPRYRQGRIHCSKLHLGGLVVTLPPAEPKAPSQDPFPDLAKAFTHNWLADVPAFELGSLSLSDAQLRQRRPSGFQNLITLAHAQLAARWDGSSAKVEIQALQARSSSELANASLDQVQSTLQWTPNTEPHQALKGHLQARLQAQPSPDINAQAQLRAQIPNLHDLSLTVDSQCDPCGPLPRAWKGELQAQANALNLGLNAQVQLRAPAQSLKAQLELSGDTLRSLDLSWSSEDLSGLLASLQGQSQGSAHCQGRLSPPQAECGLELDLQELRPGTQAHAKLDLHASLGGPLHATINKLRLQAFDQEVQTRGSSALFKLDPDGSASLENLKLHTTKGRSSLTLDANLSKTQDLQLELHAKRWELALLSSFVPGLDLQGRLDLSLQARKQGQSIQANAKGGVRRLRWQGQDWGRLALDLRQGKEEIRANATLFNSSMLNASLKATLPSALALSPGSKPSKAVRAQLQIKTLSQKALRLLSRQPELHGSVKGQLKVHGPLHALNGQLNLSWINAGWRTLRRDGVDLQAQLQGDRASLSLRSPKGPRSLLKLQSQVALVRGSSLSEIRWNEQAPLDLALGLSSFELAPIARVLSLPAIGGRLDAQVKLTGSPSSPRINAWLSAWRPEYTHYAAKDLTLSLVHQKHRSTLQLALFRGQGRVQAEAEVPLNLDLVALLPKRKDRLALRWLPHQHHRLTLRLRELDAAALSGIVDVPASMQAQGEVHAQGNLKVHRVWGELQAQSQLRALKSHRLRARVELDERQQTLQLHWSEKNKPVLTARAKTQGHLPDLIDQRTTWTQLPARVSLEAQEFQLARLEPWLPETLHEPMGRFDAKMRAQGLLGSLQWKGHAQLRNAGVAIVPLQQRISKLQARLALNQERLRIQRFTANAGSGTLALTGSMGLSAPAKGQLKLTLSRVPLRLAGVPHLELSALLESKLTLSPKTLLVQSQLKKGKVQVLELLTADVKSIPTNANVRFSDEIKVEGPRHKSGLSLPKLQLNTRIVDPISVQGPMIATQWGGFLNLSQRPPGFVAKGKIRATPNGTFELLSNHFVLELGSLEFTPDQGMLPYLDMRARTQVDGDEIRVAAQGPASKPRLSFESSADASREEIISALVTGSSGRNQQDGNQMMARAFSALLAESGTPINRVAKRIGVDNLRVSFGESLSDTIVSAGSWVSPKVYLESRIRAQAPEGKSRVEGHVRYNFQENWVLEGYVGDRNAGGGGIWWHRPARSRKKSTREESNKSP